MSTTTYSTYPYAWHPVQHYIQHFVEGLVHEGLVVEEPAQPTPCHAFTEVVIRRRGHHCPRAEPGRSPWLSGWDVFRSDLVHGYAAIMRMRKGVTEEIFRASCTMHA